MTVSIAIITITLAVLCTMNWRVLFVVAALIALAHLSPTLFSAIFKSLFATLKMLVLASA